jgi:glycosyltransferase involved in cell wall biosynthesis
MKKEIIFVIGSLGVGGAEGHLVSVLPGLAARGLSVRLLTLTHKGALASVLEEKGISVVSVLSEKSSVIFQKLPNLLRRMIQIFQSVVGVARILKTQKKEDAAIVHFFLPEAYILGMIGATLAGFKGLRIMSRRSLKNYQKKRPGVAWCEKKMHAKTKMILGNSLPVVAQLAEEGVPVERLKLIYNGIDIERFNHVQSRNESRKNLNIAEDAFVMIIVANLIPYKGHVDLLDALNDIKSQLPDNWRLLCVGRDDGIGKSLKQKSEQLCVQDNILWLGSRSDIPDLLSMADVGLLCSHEEGFSNAILEGMAAGLPMIVTNVGGNAEAVIDGKTGYVVPARDGKALGQAILALVRDREKASALGMAGKARVIAHFTLETCVDAYVQMYESCLA